MLAYARTANGGCADKGAVLTPFSLAQTVRHTALQTLAGAGFQKGEAKGDPAVLRLGGTVPCMCMFPSYADVFTHSSCKWLRSELITAWQQRGKFRVVLKGT